MSTRSGGSSTVGSEPNDNLNWELHRIIFIYNGFVAVVVLLLFIVSTGRGKSCRLHHPESSALTRELVALVVLLFVIVPYAMFGTSLFCGGWIALAEGWSFVIGFEYILSNISGVALGLTTAVPSTVFGDFVDIVTSLWAMVFATVVIGIVGGMAFVNRAIAMLPSSPWALLRCVLLYIPAALLVIAAVAGLSISAAEGWPAYDGFAFMVGSLCGLANPLTTVTPITPGGTFVEILAIVAELCLGSAVIGVASAHPICQKVVSILEGKESQAQLAGQEAQQGAKTAPAEKDMAGSKLAWTSPVVPVEATPPNASKSEELAQAHAREEAAEARQDLDSLRAKQRLLEVRLRNAEEAAGSAEEEAGLLKKQLATAQKVAVDLREENARRADAERGLQKRTSDLEEQNGELEAERRKLQGELSHLRDQMAQEIEDV